MTKKQVSLGMTYFYACFAPISLTLDNKGTALWCFCLFLISLTSYATTKEKDQW